MYYTDIVFVLLFQLLTHEAVVRWDELIMKGIKEMCLIMIELISVRLKYKPIPIYLLNLLSTVSIQCIYLSIYLSIHSSIYLFIYPFINIFSDLSIFSFIGPFFHRHLMLIIHFILVTEVVEQVQHTG